MTYHAPDEIATLTSVAFVATEDGREITTSGKIDIKRLMNGNAE